MSTYGGGGVDAVHNHSIFSTAATAAAAGGRGGMDRGAAAQILGLNESFAEADELITEFQKTFSAAAGSVSGFSGVSASAIQGGAGTSNNAVQSSYADTDAHGRHFAVNSRMLNDLSAVTESIASADTATSMSGLLHSLGLSGGDSPRAAGGGAAVDSEGASPRNLRSSGSGSVDEMEIVAILQKYSDKLVDLVSDKVAAKMSSTGTGTGTATSSNTNTSTNGSAGVL
jgi:hypothetical protein